VHGEARGAVGEAVGEAQRRVAAHREAKDAGALDVEMVERGAGALGEEIQRKRRAVEAVGGAVAGEVERDDAEMRREAVGQRQGLQPRASGGPVQQQERRVIGAAELVGRQRPFGAVVSEGHALRLRERVGVLAEFDEHAAGVFRVQEGHALAARAGARLVGEEAHALLGGALHRRLDAGNAEREVVHAGAAFFQKRSHRADARLGRLQQLQRRRRSARRAGGQKAHRHVLLVYRLRGKGPPADEPFQKVGEGVGVVGGEADVIEGRHRAEWRRRLRRIAERRKTYRSRKA
jgi:hypothetical protein